MNIKSMNKEEYPFVLFAMDEAVFAVSCVYVLSIEMLRQTTPVVNAPVYSLGMTDYRGKTIGLIGLRKLFGKPIRGEGRRVSMQRNHAEHEKWFNEIENAVRMGCVPDLPLEPSSCALGRWISTFRSKSHSLKKHVEKMAVPHRLLHESAGKIAKLMADGYQDEALKQLDKLKATHYTEVIHLIDTTVDAYLADVHDMLIILSVNGMTKGIVVDDIIGVEYIDNFLDTKECDAQTQYVRDLAERGKGGSIILLLDEAKLVAL